MIERFEYFISLMDILIFTLFFIHYLYTVFIYHSCKVD